MEVIILQNLKDLFLHGLRNAANGKALKVRKYVLSAPFLLL